MDTLLRLERFFSRYKSFYYKRRENIIFEKEEPGGVYFIIKGSVRTLILTKDGKELTNSLLASHDIFPILWIFYGSLPGHTFQALTDVEVKKAPKEDFLALIKEDQDLYAFTMKQVINRLEDASSRLETALLGNAYEKIVHILVFIAEHMGIRQNGNIIIDIPLTHQEIGDMVRLARETVTIEMDKLLEEGLITYKGKELIITEKLLKEKENLFK